jgi:hypothetical protein
MDFCNFSSFSFLARFTSQSSPDNCRRRRSPPHLIGNYLSWQSFETQQQLNGTRDEQLIQEFDENNQDGSCFGKLLCVTADINSNHSRGAQFTKNDPKTRK